MSQAVPDSPMDSQTSVYKKSAPATAPGTSAVTSSRAPDSAASLPAISCTRSDGCSDQGAQIRTSMPSSAPVTSSEFATLFRPSPR